MVRKDAKFLLLTDIHFRTNTEGTSCARDYERHLGLLIKTCKDIYTNESIDYVIILGDLCDKGNVGGVLFIQSLIDNLGETIIGKVFMIPGNHDLDRKSIENHNIVKVGKLDVDLYEKFYARTSVGPLSSSVPVAIPSATAIHPTSIPETEKPRRLEPETVLKYINGLSTEDLKGFAEGYFSPYVNAYKKIIAAPCSSGLENPFGGFSYLPDKKIGIIRLNSCWNAVESETDYGRILIGKRAVEEIESQIEEKLNDTDRRKVTFITLIHHPFSWYCYEELTTFDATRDTTYDRILQLSDIIFCGHSHGTFKGYTVINFPYLENENKKVLFIESQATLSQPAYDYYPSCISVINIVNDHSVLKRTDYIYVDKAKSFNKFERKEEILLSKYSDNSSKLPVIEYLNFDQYDDSKFLTLLKDLPLQNILEEKILVENNIVNYSKSDGFYISGAGKKYVKFMIVENNKDIKIPLKEILSSFEEKREDDSFRLEVYFLYQSRLYFGEKKIEDFETHLYEQFEEVVKKKSKTFVNKNYFCIFRQLTSYDESLA